MAAACAIVHDERGGSSCTRPGRGSSCAVAGGCDRDGVAPKCFCGVYAILYKSRIASNPNRMFLGCPFFKVKERCCRYFVCLDEHLKKIRAMEFEALGAVDDVGGVDIEDHVVQSLGLEKKIQLLRSQELEKKMKELERKLLCMEKEKRMSMWHIALISVVFVVAVCFLKW
ncbi:uncharacterized protein At4g04775-like [Arachis duranensis]|uniref:Uncharacterized protein At4g04775-like n=1 Tax=Arachis duranensis TaxID=130453 RepID=A0A6P4D7Z6_ARADU|nr:uncharacterized protein At4g04775-like [Arachis duranensis]